jgi:hypothetical protein
MALVNYLLNKFLFSKEKFDSSASCEKSKVLSLQAEALALFEVHIVLLLILLLANTFPTLFTDRAIMLFLFV